jgi:hypothetical protein
MLVKSAVKLVSWFAPVRAVGNNQYEAAVSPGAHRRATT